MDVLQFPQHLHNSLLRRTLRQPAVVIQDFPGLVIPGFIFIYLHMLNLASSIALDLRGGFYSQKPVFTA